jgi:hypothetical protein
MFVEVKTRMVDYVLRSKMESVRIGSTESILVPLDKHNSLSADIEKARSVGEPVGLKRNPTPVIRPELVPGKKMMYRRNPR